VLLKNVAVGVSEVTEGPPTKLTGDRKGRDCKAYTDPSINVSIRLKSGDQRLRLLR
jgi:hypothetical protein